jgi:hypothetical protein
MLRKRNPITKNQRWKPIHQEYKANENTSKHNPKKKEKTNNQQKSDKKPYAKRQNPKKKQKCV